MKDTLSSNSYSIKSSLLTDEMLLQRRKKEKYALILGLISQFLWALNSIQLKTYRVYYTNEKMKLQMDAFIYMKPKTLQDVLI